VVLRKFWPDGLPETIEALPIPFTAVAGDLMTRAEIRMSKGPLLSAVAGSMAIPGLVKPVQRDGHLLVDGFVVNPVPVDVLAGAAPIVIAVDLQAAENRAKPAVAPKNPYDALLQAAQIMELTLSIEKFRVNPPTIHVVPDVARFGSLDFLSIRDILRAADPLKVDLARRLLALDGGQLPAPGA
jgi:NTE family protein